MRGFRFGKVVRFDSFLGGRDSARIREPHRWWQRIFRAEGNIKP